MTTIEFYFLNKGALLIGITDKRPLIQDAVLSNYFIQGALDIRIGQSSALWIKGLLSVIPIIKASISYVPES